MLEKVDLWQQWNFEDQFVKKQSIPMMITLCLIVIFICQNVLAQDLSLGKCPKFSVMENFDLKRVSNFYLSLKNKHV